MNLLQQAVMHSFHDGIYKFILSNPKSKKAIYKKIVMNKLESCFQLEKFTEKQVFHETIEADSLPFFIETALENDYRQYNAWDGTMEYSIRISSKGKVLCTKNASAMEPRMLSEHNRTKNYLLKEGTIIEPLIDMGIFTKEGKVVKSMYDKYKQINRFVEMIDDEIQKLPSGKPLTVIDFGCGKSYLTFVLYYYFTKINNRKVRMIGLDLKDTVINRCNETAKKYGYSGLSFELGDISGYCCDFPVDMVITLHACDTATDFALYNAIKWKAGLIFSVPCCQHELNAQMESRQLSLITRYGIIKERTAALITDAIRGNLLEYCGYRTKLLEFVDLTHTPKNILIRAKRENCPSKRASEMLDEVQRLTKEFSLSPTLYRLLEQDGFLDR